MRLLYLFLLAGCSSSALVYEPAGGRLDLSEGDGFASVEGDSVGINFEYLDAAWRVAIAANVDADGFDGDLSEVDRWYWYTFSLADEDVVDFACDDGDRESPVTGRLRVQPLSDGEYAVRVAWDKEEGGCQDASPRAALRLGFRTSGSP